MKYSIFEDTMADMTYFEIERLIKEEAVVLFPIAVIEEHGPHLPLGTDTYLTYAILKHVKKLLEDMGMKSVIAPPYYWGINVATGGFVGSFTVKVNTMKAVIKDCIECLEQWGFKQVYFLNMHGDFLHSKTIVDITREIYELDGKINVYDIIPQIFANLVGLKGNEPYILVQKDEEDRNRQPQQYVDIHAGGFETSLMLVEFDELVDDMKARELQSSKTTFELLRKWQRGGEEAKEVTPMGYCGDPSNISIEDARKFILEFANITAELIKGTKIQ
ncbi:creatininase family protein [Clostridium formicaceticum]|uniref:Creatininase n=1 Tax=Clostridium formicaceticum TaxID=1497 RepID=A0AAC9RMF6_9CLOT|nr:creatininase family protein [Clostridium formicaceticum]AOY77719.1 creatininase [Clostridium formicaceticum]ARE88312.1 Creatinine amidohydrolase [Clostridium formicaceticum]